MKKSVLLFSLVILSNFYISTAYASWGREYCDIANRTPEARTRALMTAVRAYNLVEEDDRLCTEAIRFKKGGDSGVIPIPQGFSIDQPPAEGSDYGLAIRKCLASEPGCEPGQVTLDASGFVGEPGEGWEGWAEGDCPIRIVPGAMIDITNIRLIVKNTKKAVCKADSGETIPLRDQTNSYAYIHNVKIDPAVERDGDGDLILDGDDNCPSDANPGQEDVDGDGVGDACDSDDDNDRVPDARDNCPLVSNPSQRNLDGDSQGDLCDDDEDGDGTIDALDNCPRLANNQTDNDGDGIGDACDTDDDNDGVYDELDNCEFLSNPGWANNDGDGEGDVCDSDDDNDGVVDGRDNCPRNSNYLQTDTDMDRLGDACDTDDDGDAVADTDDPCPLQANVLQNSLGECASEPPPPPDLDADNDGLNDDVDPCPYHANMGKNSLDQCAPEPVPPASSPDSDSDGLSDEVERDLGTEPEVADSDGDGVQDPLDCAPLDFTRSTGDSCIVVIEDTDLDDDGVPNADDNCLFALNVDQMDSDVDGIGDACDVAVFLPSESESIDGDSDGLPDELEGGQEFCSSPDESDTDGDGLSDGVEATGITNQNGRGGCDPDVDADGICDGRATILEKDESGEVKKDDAGNDIVLCTTNPATGEADNCPIVENEDQSDQDGDGIGDACQGDDDGDSLLNEEDNCPFIANKEQRDDDEDGAGDACDLDFDVFAALSAAEGCGCRIGSERPGDIASMIPFLAIGLPVVFFRVMRRGKKIAG